MADVPARAEGFLWHGRLHEVDRHGRVWPEDLRGELAPGVRLCRTRRGRTGSTALPGWNSTRLGGPDEIRDQLERAPAGHADRIRECPEANPGGIRSMEGARQFQDRILRDSRRRMGRT